MKLEGGAEMLTSPPVEPQPDGGTAPEGTLELVSALCGSLEAEGVAYCHWKSNEALDRSASGENDLDLLVSRSDAPAFEGVLRRLGFKDARIPRWKQLPGIWHSYGLDRSTGRLVHVHAHYQLVIGDDMTKNFHLPIEEAYIASSVPAPPFRVPAPEFELALLVLRMVIKHCTWDALVSRQGSLSASERRELVDLLGRVDPGRASSTLAEHLPFLHRDLWDRCLRAIQPGASVAFRLGAARRLHRALAGCARRGRAADTYLKMWRRARIFVPRRVFRRRAPAKGLGTGGLLVAIVGGDGSGKSTVVDGLSSWLGKDFSTRTVHLGKPPRSATSAVVKAAMQAAASVRRAPTPSGRALRESLDGSDGGSMTPRHSARLVWEVLTARDRYRAYRRARRAATNGAIVICDRFPLPEVRSMDGAVTARMADPARWGRLASSLARREKRSYERIAYPDVLVVLRVEPDVVVERRRADPESMLRSRSAEVWSMDWRRTPAVVIDGSLPKDEVLSAVKAAIWTKV